MLLGIDWSPWLPIITAGLIALTILVGIRGLYQDHTKNGKLTRAGWGVVAAMVVLGILTFLSGLLDQRIAAEKERAEAAEREERFQRQMASLRGLETGMRESLGKQERLFGVANRNLNTSEALQQQTRENTDSVLRRVFAEGNRISAERIAISVAHQCPWTPDDRRQPQLTFAVLIVDDAAGRVTTLTTRQKINVMDRTIFHGFLGDLGSLETFAGWRHARIAIGLSVIPLDAPLMARLPESFACPASVSLLLNGRQVLNASTEIGFGGIHGYGANLVDLHVDPNRLPRL